MLGRRTLLLLAVLAVLLASAPVSAPAWAGDGSGKVECAKSDPRPACDINVGTGGSTGGSAGGGGTGDSGGDGCSYKPADPSPDIIDAFGGQPSGQGQWYWKVCSAQPDNADLVWMAGAPPVVSPEVLARQARAKLALPAVVIRLNPPDDQLANLPVWLTLDPASWRQQSATASVPGVSVTATARPVRAAWSMGDGGSVTCAGPGTAWAPGTDPAAASPDCGYVYRRSSAGAPAGTYTVTVTVMWEVTWAGAGQSGTVPGLTTTGQIQTRVQESQAVISR
ncbi:hypothetical protein ACNTMW_12940 [Planosporangium sp. 12N6]|uniref:hypothetical protein n=1 Tax=Planosporangium spinosum TaxID=3402278 RepID=UPI003CF986BE